MADQSFPGGDCFQAAWTGVVKGIWEVFGLYVVLEGVLGSVGEWVTDSTSGQIVCSNHYEILQVVRVGQACKKLFGFGSLDRFQSIYLFLWVCIWCILNAMKVLNLVTLALNVVSHIVCILTSDKYFTWIYQPPFWSPDCWSLLDHVKRICQYFLLLILGKDFLTEKSSFSVSNSSGGSNLSKKRV